MKEERLYTYKFRLYPRRGAEGLPRPSVQGLPKCVQSFLGHKAQTIRRYKDE